MFSELPVISKVLFVVFAAFLLQALGGYYQIKNYRKTVREIHRLGNVGIGQKKGKFFNGNIVMIAADGEGVIKGVMILDGISFLAKFHPVEKLFEKELVGNSIYTFLEITDEFDKKMRKKYLGWVRALEALRMRLDADLDEEDGEEEENS
ncbi:MAG: transcriptional regulator [Dorea sp.]|nr:transcriptional regulator [Dorea sp.]